MPKQSCYNQEWLAISWRHPMKFRSLWSISKSILFKRVFQYSSDKGNSTSSDGHMKERVKWSSLLLYSYSKTIQNCCSLLGICSSLVFQFGRSFVDVAAENHDAGRFANSWLKNPSRTPIWWLYINSHMALEAYLAWCFFGLLWS